MNINFAQSIIEKLQENQIPQKLADKYIGALNNYFYKHKLPINDNRYYVIFLKFIKSLIRFTPLYTSVDCDKNLLKINYCLPDFKIDLDNLDFEITTYNESDVIFQTMISDYDADTIIGYTLGNGLARCIKSTYKQFIIHSIDLLIVNKLFNYYINQQFKLIKLVRK